MAQYTAPLNDMQFLLEQVFEAPSHWERWGKSAEWSMELAGAVLEEAAKVIAEEVAPINRQGDEIGSVLEGQEVKTPPGFKEAFALLGQNGWMGLTGDVEYGGQGMPKAVTLMVDEMLYGSNSSFALFVLLSGGCALALSQHATDADKQVILPKIFSGEWAGTMCLTEPQAGSDLGMVRTKAVPQDDGTYLLSGDKIFITGGDHDLTDNITHLVLAKIPGAPEGSRGISLFIVPKYQIDDEGNLLMDEQGNKRRNGVDCVALEHKMGIKASPTSALQFTQAKGMLVGEPNRGLNCMFTMMNDERLSMGIQGVGLAKSSYETAHQYALERLQGRAASGTEFPDQAADPIIVHADVRRMLLTQRVWVESGRALALYVAMALDAAEYAPDDAERMQGLAVSALMTPVAKAFLSDRGFDACVLGQQIFGGHGYIREWGMEQLVRDARIAQIYEGTNGIQAQDLVERKVLKDKGKIAQVIFAELNDFCQHSEHPLAKKLQAAVNHLVAATDYLLATESKAVDIQGLNAVDYLELFGLVMSAYLLLKSTEKAAHFEQGLFEEKLEVTEFMFARLLPKANYLAGVICSSE